MEFIIGAVIVVVVLLVLVNLRARSIVKRHARTLSHRTGIPADQIRREMINGNLTPGEWAATHGLDPMTFQPRAGFISERPDPPISMAMLADRTGIPEDQIMREVMNDILSPGEWAARHGLDPMTFQQQPGTVARRDRGTGGGVDDEMRPTQVAVDRLRSLADTPLAAWTSCPVCTSDLVQPFEDVQACQRCFRAYTVGGMEPEARNDAETVVMTGTKPYASVMITDLARAHYPILVWHVRPPDMPSTAPPILPDDELEIRAFSGT